MEEGAGPLAGGAIGVAPTSGDAPVGGGRTPPALAAVGGAGFVLGWIVSEGGATNPLDAVVGGAGLALACGLVGGYLTGRPATPLGEAARAVAREVKHHLRQRSLPAMGAFAAFVALAVVAFGPVGPVGVFAAGAAILLVHPAASPTVGVVRIGLIGVTPAALVTAVVVPTPARVVVLVVTVLVAVAGRFVGRPPAAAAAIVLMALVATATAGTAGVATKTVKVPGTQGTFKASGIDVPAGKEVTLTVKGKVRFLEGDDDAQAEVDGGPAFYSGCDPVAYCGQLLARVGDQGGGFAVVRDHHVAVGQAGPLQFAVNDFDASDNTGTFTVAVDVHDAPPPTAPGTFTPATLSPSTSSGGGDGDGDGDGSTTPQPGPRTHATAGLAAAITAIGGTRHGRRRARA